MANPRSFYLLAIAATVLNGCGLISPSAVPSTSLATSPGRNAGLLPTDTLNRVRTASWMNGDAAGKDLLYVANADTVTVYSYPGGKLEGSLTGFYRTEGECLDAQDDIFITNYGTAQIFEYAHGGTSPIATIKTSPGPVGCSVDAKTGNLAVSTLGGIVSIYKNAHGTPKTYKDPAVRGFFLCAFDSHGDLFVDGQDDSDRFIFVELKEGKATFSTIDLDQSIGWPGGVDWINGTAVVGDQSSPVVYGFKITGSKGSKISTTPLGGTAYDVMQFFVDGNSIIAPNEYFTGKRSKVKTRSNVLTYGYPSGGQPISTISKGVNFPTGVVVSKSH